MQHSSVNMFGNSQMGAPTSTTQNNNNSEMTRILSNNINPEQSSSTVSSLSNVLLASPSSPSSSMQPALSTSNNINNNETNNIGDRINEAIFNRFQPNHCFLNQQSIDNKTPLCLINEICRSHNLKAEFVVLNSVGPEHSKTFSVLLKLGEFERFVGKNSSIKSAQRTAAIIALQNTRLKFPNPKPNLSPRAYYHGMHSNQMQTRHSFANQTPASELNTLLMKKGFQPVYNVTTEKITINHNNNNNNQSNNFMLNNGIKNNNCNNYMLHPKPPPNMSANNNNNFHHHNHPRQFTQNKQNNPFPYQGSSGTSRQASMNMFQNHHSSSSSVFQNCDSQSPLFNRNNNSFYRPNPTTQHNFESKENNSNNNNSNYFHHQLSNVMNSDVVNVGPNLSLHFNHSNINNRDGKVNRWNNNMDSKLPIPDFPNQISQFVAYVEFDGHKFCGKGKTSQIARHEAAKQGLKFLKSLEIDEKTTATKDSDETKVSNLDDSQAPPAAAAVAADNTKTSVSLIHEIASQNRFKVAFDLCGQSGQAHIPSFEIRCMLYLNESEEPFMTANAEDRTKKGAKKKAAQLMLDQIKVKQEEGCEHFKNLNSKNAVTANSNEDNGNNNTNNNQTSNNRNMRNSKQNRAKKSNIKNNSSVKSSADQTNSSNVDNGSNTAKQCTNGNDSNSNRNLYKNRQEYNRSNRQPNPRQPSMTDSTTSKAITFLYQITRNLNIPTPVYHSTVVDGTTALFANFAEQFTTVNDLRMHQVECTLFLDQTLPQTISCKVKSIGYATEPKMAKNISTHICLLKLGFKSPVEQFSEDYRKSLKFSLIANQTNSNDNSIVTDNLDELLDSKLEDKLDLAHEAGASVEISTVEPNMTNEQLIAISCNIKQNCRFVLYLLRKLYWPIFRSSKKNIDNLFEKMEASFTTFFNSSDNCPEGADEIIQSKCNTIKSLMQHLDGSKYWNHLQLLSSLISVDSNEEEKQSTNLFLKFKCHNLAIESKPLLDSSKVGAPDTAPKTVTNYVAIVSANCDKLLSSTAINFNLFKNNFVNFGLGTTSEKAQEVASCWALRNLAYIAMKQRIENDFESNTTNQQQQQPANCKAAETKDKSSSSTTVSDLNLSKSKSTPSSGQLKSKSCLTVLFDICRQLVIHKPVLNCLPTDDNAAAAVVVVQSNPDESKSDDLKTETSTKSEPLYHVECIFSFYQELPQKLSSTIVFHGYGNTKRIARTIASYFALIMLGVPPIAELLEIDNFDKYYKYSLEKNVSIVGRDQLVSLNDPLKPVPVIGELGQHQLDEVKRNYDFMVRILMEIYKPFLKNHKMKDCISPLVSKIDSELFEYHNHRQQIMDSSGSFDKCSESIRNSIDKLLKSIDATKFWQHLQLLSTIVSTLTTDLDNPLTPPVLEFKCHFLQSGKVKSDEKSGLDDPDKVLDENLPAEIVSSEKATGVEPSTVIQIAVIKLICHWPSIDHLGLSQKTFLSYAMGVEEDTVREAASYKALRHLAVNFCK